jgi:hypothetical protein
VPCCVPCACPVRALCVPCACPVFSWRKANVPHLAGTSAAVRADYSSWRLSLWLSGAPLAPRAPLGPPPWRRSRHPFAASASVASAASSGPRCFGGLVGACAPATAAAAAPTTPVLAGGLAAVLAVVSAAASQAVLAAVFVVAWARGAPPSPQPPPELSRRLSSRQPSRRPSLRPSWQRSGLGSCPERCPRSSSSGGPDGYLDVQFWPLGCYCLLRTVDCHNPLSQHNTARPRPAITCSHAHASSIFGAHASSLPLSQISGLWPSALHKSE